MKHNRLRAFSIVLLLIAATAVALAYSAAKEKPVFSAWVPTPPQQPAPVQDIVKISAQLVQDKILLGSDGRVHLALTLEAAAMSEAVHPAERHVDMVIVLDRSGSMQGQKIEDARHAILHLLSRLTQKDRMALIAYADTAQHYTGLLNFSAANRRHLQSIVHGIQAGGATNLSAGLQAGINTLVAAGRTGNTAKVILISDGLANRGITDPEDLGRTAGIAVEKEFSVSTVGVGADFDEYLLTRIADRGTGTYYYLENPGAFAEVFEKEFFGSQATIANSVAVHLPLQDGISLVHAAGYPVQIQNGCAVFYPGSLQAGQVRNIFLTLHIPSQAERDVEIGTISATYVHHGQRFETCLAKPLAIACIKNEQEVFSAIDKTSWTRKVLQEDFNRLKQEVALEIKAGQKSRALDRIDSYYNEQKTMNAAVGSTEVSENLTKDLEHCAES